MPDEVSTIGVRLTLDASGFSSGLDAASGELNAFQKQASQAGAGVGSLHAGGKPGGKAPGSAMPVDVTLSVSEGSIAKLRKQVAAGLQSIPVTINPQFATTGKNSIQSLMGSVLSTQYGITPQQGRVAAAAAIERAQGSLPRKALGGPVEANRPVIVGERRAEVFVPKTAGLIHPSIKDFYRKQEETRRFEVELAAVDASRQRQHDQRIHAMAGRRSRGGGIKHAGIGSMAYKATIASGGATMPAIPGISVPTTGHALGVSAYLPGAESYHVPQNDVRGFIRAVWAQRQAGAPFVGTWLDPETGLIDIDPSTVVSNKREADMLLRGGREKAAFDLGRFNRLKAQGIDPGAAADQATWYASSKPLRASAERLRQIMYSRAMRRQLGGGALFGKEGWKAGRYPHLLTPGTLAPGAGWMDRDWRSQGLKDITEWVSVDTLQQFRTHDREFHPRYAHDTRYLDELTEKIYAEGFDPSKPIAFSHDPYWNTGKIEDGNHRFAVARRLGIDKIPTAGQLIQQPRKKFQGWVMPNEHMLAPDAAGYIPHFMPPSWFGIRKGGGPVHAMAGRILGATDLARHGPTSAMERNIWDVVNRLSPHDVYIGENWYPIAGKIAREAARHSGYPSERRARAVLAATSPQMLFASNVAHTAAMLQGAMRGEYPTKLDADALLPRVGEWIDQFLGPGNVKLPKGVMGLPRMHPSGVPGGGEKAWQIATSKDRIHRWLSGPKVVPFDANLGGNLDVATLDALAAQIATAGAYMQSPGVGVFRDAMNEAYHNVHAQLPRSLKKSLPRIAQLQAATWVNWRGAGMQQGGFVSMMHEMEPIMGWQIAEEKLKERAKHAQGGLMARLGEPSKLASALEAKAAEMFGITEDPMAAGWLAPSGKYVDFSALGSGMYQKLHMGPMYESTGMVKGTRTIPHYAARHIVGTNTPYEQVYEKMLDSGFLRMGGFSPGFFEGQMSSPLTFSQRSRLLSDLKGYDVEEMFLDLTSHGPHAMQKGHFRSLLAYDRASAASILQEASAYADMPWSQLPGKGKYWNPDTANIEAATNLARVMGQRRATGGPGSLDGLYIVGEIGEELFVPNRLAHMIPKKVMDQIPKAAGGMQVIGKRRDHDLGGELFAPPEDGVIIPNRLMAQVPRAEGGTTVGDWEDERRLRSQDRQPMVSEFADRVFSTLTQTWRLRGPRGRLGGIPQSGPLPPVPVMTGGFQAAGPAVIEQLDVRNLSAQNVDTSPPSGGGGGGGAAGGGRRGRPTQTDPYMTPGQDPDRAAQDRMRAQQLSEAGQALSARTPRGYVAQLASTFMGRGRGQEMVNLARQREALRARQGIEEGMPDSRPIKEYLALEDKLTLARADAKAPIQAEIDTLVKANPVLKDWNKAREEESDALRAGVPGLTQGLVGLGKVMAGIQVYSWAMEGVGMAMQAADPAARKIVDSLMNFEAQSEATTTQLGKQTREQLGNTEATMNAYAIQNNLSTGLNEAAAGPLTLESAVKAGAEVAGKWETAIESALGANRSGMPSGTMGGFGGLFGGELAGELLGGGKGVIEQLAGAAMKLTPDTASYREGSPLGRLGFVGGEGWEVTPGMGRDRYTQSLYDALVGDQAEALERGRRSYAIQSNEAGRAYAMQAAGVSVTKTQSEAEIGAAMAAIPEGVEYQDLRNLTSTGIIFKLNDGSLADATQAIAAAVVLGVGLGVQDPATWSKEQARVMGAQWQGAQALTERQVDIGIPFSTWQQITQNPLISPSAGVSTVGASAATQRQARRSFADTEALQADIKGIAAEGLANQRDEIQRLTPQNAGAFSVATAEATALSVSIAGLTEDMMAAQKVAADTSYLNQIRIAQRSLGDAVGMLGQVGGTRLGYLQREEWLTSRASQSLGLASQKIGLIAQGLSLALERRSIATSLAVAQFQAPGETGEERFARQREAVIAAGIRQRQLGLSTQQYGISQQQLPLAQQQFAIAGKIWVENAQRNALDARKAIEVMQTARDAEVKTTVAQRQIAAASQKMGDWLNKAATYANQAERKHADIINKTIEGVASLGLTFEEVDRKLRARFELEDRDKNFDPLGSVRTPNRQPTARELAESQGLTTTGSGTTARELRDKWMGKQATGMVGTYSTPTSAIFGEAGTETVAILRNPRMGMLNMGGGGGPVNLTINIDRPVVREERDVAHLARRVAEEVERALGRKGQMMGLRRPSY